MRSSRWWTLAGRIGSVGWTVAGMTGVLALAATMGAIAGAPGQAGKRGATGAAGASAAPSTAGVSASASRSAASGGAASGGAASGGAASGGAASGGLGATAAAARTAAAPASAATIERGRYLVTTGACYDCHTPWVMGPKGPHPDAERHLSGHPASVRLTPPPRPVEGWGMVASSTNTAFAGPWGISFAANLTPDKETGLGNWTEELFLSTLRSGRHAGVQRQILPPMPWHAYAQMTDQDLKSIFAYLQSIKPIRNAVPAPVPPMTVPTH